MGISSSEPGFQAQNAPSRARDLTESVEPSNARRRLGRILCADNVAIIRTNLAAQIGLKPTRFSRYDN